MINMNTSQFQPGLANIYQETADSAQENEWKFNLLYTHPKAYTPFVDLFFLGYNPRGSDDADSATIAASGGRTVDDGKEPLFSAYLDEVWINYGKPKGSARLQRKLQKVASLLLPGRGAELLRKTPASNIIPFHSSGVSTITDEQKRCGKKIGFALLDFCRPKVVFCYGYDENESPWAYLRQRCRDLATPFEPLKRAELGNQDASIKCARMTLWGEQETLLVATKHLSYPTAKHVYEEISAIQPLVTQYAGWQDALPFSWDDDERRQWLRSIHTRDDFPEALRGAVESGVYGPSQAVLNEAAWLLDDPCVLGTFHHRLKEGARRCWGKPY